VSQITTGKPLKIGKLLKKENRDFNFALCEMSADLKKNMKNSSKYTAVIVRIERRLYKKKKSCMYRYKYVWKVDKIIAPRENNRKTTLYPALTEARML